VPVVTVSLVIPTTWRFSVNQAISSALAQSLPVLEIIVVGKGPVPEWVDQRPRFIQTEVLVTGGAARQLGTDAANGDWIAYLDDDDVWDKDKNKVQCEFIEATGFSGLLCSRVIIRRDRSRHIWPRTVGDADFSDICSYLFGRQDLRPGDRYFPSSVMMLPTHTAREIGWRHDLLVHQDWDFYLRAAHKGQRFRMLPEVLGEIDQLGKVRVSKSGRWKASIDYFSRAMSADLISRNLSANAILRASLQLALDSKDFRGVVAVLSAATALGGDSRSWMQAALRSLGIRRVAIALNDAWSAVRRGNH